MLKKLQKYIRKGWLNGWLDEKSETLYLTAEDYRAAQDTAAAPQAQPQPEPAPEQREETPLNLETARRFAAVLELEGAVLSVQAFCDTGFSVQDPLTGQAVVLVDYPAVRSALPQELRTFLDRYFACGTAPPPELRVRLVPCSTIAGHSVLPAVPAKALCTSKGSAAGILAAFCRPEAQQPWTALLGSELAVQLGIR